MIELKRILVPLDGSPLAERALPLAMALAQKHRSEIILLRVLRIFRTFRGVYGEIPLSRADEIQLPLYREAKEYLRAWQGKLHLQGFNVNMLLRDSVPVKGITETAKVQHVDLMVMATHGRTGLARWISGSVADEVVRHSPCPVLLVRPDQETKTRGKGKPVTDDWYRLRNGSQHRFPIRGILLPEYM